MNSTPAAGEGNRPRVQKYTLPARLFEAIQLRRIAIEPGRHPIAQEMVELDAAVFLLGRAGPRLEHGGAIEKRGDAFALFVSLEGEPMHQFGPPITLHLDEPFYVGIVFCSHLPVTSDTAVLSNVVLENAAGRVR